MKNKQLLHFYLPVFISAVGYISLGYFLPRDHAISIVGTYTILFLLLYWFYTTFEISEIKYYIAAGIIFRMLFLFSTPALSDDFYRFIWDGELILNGINPYIHFPSSLVGSGSEVMKEIYSQLNSPFYYSVYPPASQWIFTFTASIYRYSPTLALFSLHGLVLLAEIGSIFLLIKLTRKFRLPQKKILLYLLNPLVILELTGNLHFEAFVIFFMLMSFSLIVLEKHLSAGVSFGLAIATKLLPLIYLPIFLRRMPWKNRILSGLIGVIVVIISFIPFMSIDSLSGMWNSIGLFFQRFEFNASIYYLVREWGYYTKGYNIIQTAGPLLAKITIVLISLLIIIDLFKKRSLSEMICWMGLGYFSLSTTVHPWYIIPLIAFSVLTKYYWPLVWSFLIFFTYAGYEISGFHENYYVVAVEYLAVFTFAAYEFKTKGNKRVLVKHEI